MGIISIVRRLIADALNSVSTADIAIVQSISDDRKYCSVMPKRVAFDGTNSPIIEHVPIVYQKSGNSVILAPPKIGDVGLVVTNKFALDTLLIDNETNPLKSARQFSVNDIVYVGGLFTEIDNIPDILDGELIIHHESGAHIKFDGDGNLEIKVKRLDINEL